MYAFYVDVGAPTGPKGGAPPGPKGRGPSRARDPFRANWNSICNDLHYLELDLH